MNTMTILITRKGTYKILINGKNIFETKDMCFVSRFYKNHKDTHILVEKLEEAQYEVI
jgi:hypothetical protein